MIRILSAALLLGVLIGCAVRSGGPVYTSDAANLTLPRLITEVKPSYTPEAMDARVAGSVMLQALVLPDGTIGEVKVTESLDQTHGLDDQAINAVRQWEFAPGTRHGEPVSVWLDVEVRFTLGRPSASSVERDLSALLDNEHRIGSVYRRIRQVP